jgi:hypothetical protein
MLKHARRIPQNREELQQREKSPVGQSVRLAPLYGRSRLFCAKNQRFVTAEDERSSVNP